MVHLNTNQLADAQEIAHNKEVNRARRVLVMYKASDPSFGLAMFRTQANNHTTEILARTVARKRLLKDTREWLATWSNEPDDSVIGNGIRDYCNAVENASGLKIIS